jgi:formate--tetrahydrofolate ligase
MLSDIEIAHSTPLKPIEDVAAGIGIDANDLEHYGK